MIDQGKACHLALLLNLNRTLTSRLACRFPSNRGGLLVLLRSFPVFVLTVGRSILGGGRLICDVFNASLLLGTHLRFRLLCRIGGGCAIGSGRRLLSLTLFACSRFGDVVDFRLTGAVDARGLVVR